MNSVSASAPGKVLLSGEYAVLDRAPAICMAVNHRARVTVEQHNKDWHTVTAPGFSTAEGRFVADRDHFEWLEDGASFPLFEHVWRAANARTKVSSSWLLDTQEFFHADRGIKFGIGSSAALAAALATALCTVAAPDADTARVAGEAHRRFQSGAGSGVDVACSLQGGVIEYQMDRKQHRPIEWPQGLVFALLWSGVAANTGVQLDRFEQCAVRTSRADLGDAAEQMAAAWRKGSAQAVLDEYRRYTEALRKFDVDHDLGIFDAGHEALVDAARAEGLVYKPCGAGGGDIGIVLATDEVAIESFVASPIVASFEQLNMKIDPHGARLLRARH